MVFSNGPEMIETLPAWVLLLLLWIAVVNPVTFAVYAWDKSRARFGAWRVPESRLLFLALIGGWPGAKLAQHLLHHKTRKMPFARRLNTVPVIQLMLIGGAMTLWASLGAAKELTPAHSVTRQSERSD